MITSSSSRSQSKCYVTHGLLPIDLGVDKPGRSKKPFSTILASHWYNTVDLILPTELLSVVEAAIQREHHVLDYVRVHMKLEELIDGDFFNVYIKTGNIEMLCQGSPVNETQYSLRDGILRLDVPKHIYQRLGLDGKPIPSGGRKHVPNRMRIEINLRLPSMISGRKGFERIRSAFKNVLNESVTWLFRDCSSGSTNQTNAQPIEALHPLQRSAHPPTQTVLPTTLIPDFTATTPPRNPRASTQYLRFDTLDILDWLSLITLQSPRIDSTDTIDPYLCRYDVPSPTSTPISITTLRWHGFIPSSWLSRTTALCASIFQPRAAAWFAISATAIKIDQDENSPDGWCLLVYPERGHGDDGLAEKHIEDDAEGAVGTEDTFQMQHDAGEDPPPDPKSRDFIMWELVDCTTDR